MILLFCSLLQRPSLQKSCSVPSPWVPFFRRLTTPSWHFRETANILPGWIAVLTVPASHDSVRLLPQHLCLALRRAAGFKLIYDYCEIELCFMFWQKEWEGRSREEERKAGTAQSPLKYSTSWGSCYVGYATLPQWVTHTYNSLITLSLK